MIAHARLGASSAHRWMNCPGSVKLSEGLPEIETEYQRDGTAAHALAEVWLNHGAHTAQNLEQVYIGGTPQAITDEMREAVQLFVETVNAAKTTDTTRYVERTFTLAALRPPEPMFGTPDVTHIAPRRLHVFDFKFGQGVVVEVRDNPQLLYYALGGAIAELMRSIFDRLVPDFDETKSPLDEAIAQFDTIAVTIVQPRAPHVDGPVRTVEITPDELRAFAERLLHRAETAHVASTQAKPELNPGEWCRFCPAQGHCPALKEHAQLVAQLDFDAVPIDTPVNPETLPIEVAADLLTKVQVLEIWIGALTARVTRELEAGREVPGWKLVQKRARRVWHSTERVEEWYRKFANRPPIVLYDQVLKSPAQVEKLVGKKHLPDDLYARVSSGLTLAPASDPRPAAAIGPQEDFAALPPASIEADLVQTE